ncbi:putative Thyrotroph embryonic factor [Hypsibius exemplaris]|uniref:Thyrotroph embryonic factor n=1 Tax=Hypsibius exemplaris TaxID=2072580 RepID=A0A9X6RLX8_HYPEX|nr:putative Thyrotroph embryonic factor [Hypsibius exemplaris]
MLCDQRSTVHLSGSTGLVFPRAREEIQSATCETDKRAPAKMNHISCERTSHWVNKTCSPKRDPDSDSADAWDVDAPLDFSSKKASPPPMPASPHHHQHQQPMEQDDEVGSLADDNGSTGGSSHHRADSPPASMAVNPHAFIMSGNPNLFHHGGAPQSLGMSGPLDKLFPPGMMTHQQQQQHQQKLPSFPFTMRNTSAPSGNGKGSSKPIRPFKAYPKDSLSAFPMGFFGMPMNFAAALPTAMMDAATNPLFAAAGGLSEDAFLQYKRTAEALYGGSKRGVASAAGKPIRTGRRSSGTNSGLVSSSSAKNAGRKSDGAPSRTVDHVTAGQSASPPRTATSVATSGAVATSGTMATSGAAETSGAMAADSTGLALTTASSSPSQSLNRSESKSPGMEADLDEHGKKRGRSVPDEVKDEAYWERRRKNNEAAKRSRDSRRHKEDEIALKAAFLERENLTLRMEKKQLQAEVQKMRMIVYANAQ